MNIFVAVDLPTLLAIEDTIEITEMPGVFFDVEFSDSDITGAVNLRTHLMELSQEIH